MDKEIKKANITARIGKEFEREIEEIKLLRLKKGVDKKRTSTKILTNLLTKHDHWPEIKEALSKFDFRGRYNGDE